MIAGACAKTVQRIILNLVSIFDFSTRFDVFKVKYMRRMYRLLYAEIR